MKLDKCILMIYFLGYEFYDVFFEVLSNNIVFFE